MLRIILKNYTKIAIVRFISKESKAFINGEWILSKEGSTFKVFNPATRDQLSTVPDLSLNETDYAIECATKAFLTWNRTTALERSRMLKSMNDLLLENEEEISRIITLENGKCLEEARSEIKYSASFLEWFSEEPRRIMGHIMPSPKSDKKLIVLQQPIGVVAVITPWNFPISMAIRKLGAILAAGCTAVIKPAEDTPLSLLKFIEIVQGVIPPGVINVVTSSRLNSPMVGRVFCTDTRVKALSFTGSSEVGKILYAQCADTMKRLSLELGGNAPLIVFESANLDVAVKATMQCKFRNSGQACISANRILVHESIHDKFVQMLTLATLNLKVGYGLDEGVNQGPLINQDSLRKVEQLINRSVQLGASLQQGGTRANIENYPNGFFFQPTVITNCSSDHPLYKNEVFGPVAAISKFSNEKEVVQSANLSNAGLAGYIFSEDHRQIWRVAEELRMGIVGVNEGAVSHCEGPFSGWKESGLGSESGIYGIEEYLVKKYICWGNHI